LLKELSSGDGLGTGRLCRDIVNLNEVTGYEGGEARSLRGVV
jgi:hypothetical protein